MSFRDSSHAENDGDNHLSLGDYANIAGVNSPAPVHVPINGDTFNEDSPEHTLIWKERWQIVRQIIGSSDKHRPFVEWLLDHFSGYSFEEIGERYSVTRHIAFYRVNAMIEFLQLKIKGHPF